MLTAHDETALAIRMLTQGAFAFLIKPVSWEDLVPQVRKAMERREATIRQRQYVKDLEQKAGNYSKGLDHDEYGLSGTGG